MHNFNMGKIKTVIVEDNLKSMQQLRHLLQSFPMIEIVGHSADGDEAVRLIDRKQPDLLFLDIQLPGMNGFQVLKSISCRPLVVFISAHDHYAIKAFDANGVDYLLKPIEKERLETAMEKVLQKRSPIDPRLLEELQRMSFRRAENKRFAVKVKDQILIIPKEDVYYFNAEDKYVFLNTWDKNYFYKSTLKNLSRTLDPELFFRINKSVIISLEKVHKLKRNFRREFCVVMDDKKKSTFKISKRYLADFKAILNI